MVTRKCNLHLPCNWEVYCFKHDGGLLGQDAIHLVENVTSLLQMITFEKYKQGNLSVEWSMFCEDRQIEYVPFAKEYGSRWTHN